MRLYLSDTESRRAGEGSLLVVRPAYFQPLRWQGRWIIGSIILPDAELAEHMQKTSAPSAVGDVVPAREAWACSKDFDGQPIAGMLAESDSIWYRASIEPLEADGIATPTQAAHGQWRPAPQMPGHAVRHRLRVVKVECRRVSSITEAEVLASGCLIPVSTDGCPEDKARPLLALTGRYPAMDYMPKGPRSTWTTADYLRAIYASAWMERHGKRAAWPDGWAWFVSTEATR